MKESLVQFLRVIIISYVLGFYGGFHLGVHSGEKNPNFEKMELNEKTYPELVNRCKSIKEAEEFADRVIDIITERK